MNTQTFNSLQSKILFLAFICFLSFHINFSAPINSFPTYVKFAEEIKLNNCSFPSKVVLPLSSVAIFEYLGTQLNVCTAAEATRRPKEATRLCNEIFDILKNLTCHTQNDPQLPEIKVDMSEDVCTDISSLEFPTSASSKSLLKHLTDKFICDMICDAEFKPACKVLLWSYQVLQKIESVPKMQNEVNLKESDDVVPNNQKEDKLQDLSANVPGTSISKTAQSGTIAEIQNTLNNEDSNANELAEKHNEEMQKEIKSGTDPVNSEDSKKDMTQDVATSLNSQTERTIKSEDTKETDNLSRVKIHSDLKVKQDAIAKPQNENDAGKLSELSDNEIAVGGQNNKNELGQNKPSVKENNVGDQTNENKLGQSKQSDNKAGVEAQKNTNALAGNQPSTTPDSEKKELPDSTSKSEAVSTNLAVNTEKTENKPTEKKQNITALDMDSVPKKTTLEKTTAVGSKTNPDEPTKIAIPEPLSIEKEKQNIATKPEFTNEMNPSENKVPQVVSNDDELPPMTTIADLEKMEDGNEIPEPVNKDQDPYNDLEHEEYTKLDYDDEDDDGFYDPSKNKKTEELESNKIPDPVDETQNEPAKYDNFPQRNSMRRGPDDIQMIPTFTEQEDSHFFFYFLSIVFILMAGYLIFHNKQKIIALIVEGRHERRRRSHGVGYKKLETK